MPDKTFMKPQGCILRDLGRLLSCVKIYSPIITINFVN
jgi:hypothetical protein